MDGWLLHLGQHGWRVDRVDEFRSALRPFARRVNPWDGLVLVAQPFADRLFGWTGWELFAGPRRQGVGISITGDVRAAILLEAAEQGRMPTIEELQGALSDSPDLRSTVWWIGQLITDVEQLEQRRGPITQTGGGADELKQGLETLRNQVQEQTTEQLISQPLAGLVSIDSERQFLKPGSSHG